MVSTRKIWQSIKLISCQRGQYVYDRHSSLLSKNPPNTTSKPSMLHFERPKVSWIRRLKLKNIFSSMSKSHLMIKLLLVDKEKWLEQAKWLLLKNSFWVKWGFSVCYSSLDQSLVTFNNNIIGNLTRFYSQFLTKQLSHPSISQSTILSLPPRLGPSILFLQLSNNT